MDRNYTVNWGNHDTHTNMLSLLGWMYACMNYVCMRAGVCVCDWYVCVCERETVCVCVGGSLFMYVMPLCVCMSVCVCVCVCMYVCVCVWV